MNNFILIVIYLFIQINCNFRNLATVIANLIVDGGIDVVDPRGKSLNHADEIYCGMF